MSLMTFSPSAWRYLKIALGLYLSYVFISTNNLFGQIISPTGLFSQNHMWTNLNWLRQINLSNYDFFWMVGLTLSLALTVFPQKIFKIVLYLWWMSWCLSFPFYLYPPHISYIGFTLLFTILVNEKNRSIPKLVWLSFVIIWGLGFSISGLMKLVYSANWQQGEILQIISQSPIGYDYLLNAPIWLSKTLSYCAVAIELSCLPLVLLPATRKLGLITMLVLQMGILSTMNIPDISIGIMICLLFLILPQATETTHE